MGRVAPGVRRMRRVLRARGTVEGGGEWQTHASAGMQMAADARCSAWRIAIGRCCRCCRRLRLPLFRPCCTALPPARAATAHAAKRRKRRRWREEKRREERKPPLWIDCCRCCDEFTVAPSTSEGRNAARSNTLNASRQQRGQWEGVAGRQANVERQQRAANEKRREKGKSDLDACFLPTNV